MNPEVSVITASYNSADFIEASIRSVLSQTYADWELIVVDDASNDKTASIIEGFAQKFPKIRFVVNSANLGPALTRNRGIELARGRYISFLDADDLWAPEKLEIQTKFMAERGAVLSYASYQKIDCFGQAGGLVEVPKQANYEDLLKTNSIGCLTAMYDSRALGKRYMPNIRKRQDYGLWLSILRDGHIALGIQQGLAYYRVRNDSLSANKFSAACYQWRVYRELEGLSWMKAFGSFVQYAWRGLRKYRV